jgi:anti-sigma factor NepR-like protein
LPHYLPVDPPQDDDTSRAKAGEVGDAIKRRLKDLYDQVSAEPVPDKHRKLLEELERKSGKDKPGKTA